MIYDIRQVTTYSYGSPVGFAHHVLRLTPIDRPLQRVQAVSIDIDPAPVRRREGRDFFGNRLTWIDLDTPHDRLAIRVSARVRIADVAAPAASATPAWERVRDEAAASRDMDAEGPAHFLFASRQVSLDPEIRDYVRESFPAGRPILEAATELTGRIKRDFVYEIGATTASTTPPMSFALRRGVCQDFAHIMISGLRGLGLPASYVSGYLRTVPAADGVRLEGAEDAMHAWAQVWCGAEHGWIGFDPTNDMLAGTDHVVVAIGRDYADVAPIDGVVFASGAQGLKVAVSVVPVSA